MAVVCYVDCTPRSRKPVQFRAVPSVPKACDVPRESCKLCLASASNSRPQICVRSHCSLCKLASDNARSVDALLNNQDLHRAIPYYADNYLDFLRLFQQVDALLRQSVAKKRKKTKRKKFQTLVRNEDLLRARNLIFPCV